MTGKVKYILAAAFIAVFCLGAALLSRSDKAGRDLLCCSGVSVSLSDTLGAATAEDLLDALERGYGIAVGQRLDSVLLYRVEEVMLAEPAVRGCQAWTSGDGVLHLDIENRVPVVKFTKGGRAVYADCEGFLIHPYSAKPEVIEIKGILPFDADGAWVRGAVGLVDYIQENGLWGDLVTGISASADGDLEFSSARGRERIIFGQPENHASKFSRIEKYWSRIVPAKGNHRSVNVKFNNQIICRKDI